MLLLLIPVGIFVGTFFWLIRQFEKRMTDPETITGNHYIVSLVVAAIAGMIAFIGVYLLALSLPADVSAVQSALDEQCGKGRFVADSEGYDNDPIENWYGYEGQVSCNNMFDDGWRCICPTSDAGR